MSTAPELNPLEALARAYDREEASYRGEPDPWADEIDFAAWREERIACAEVGLKAYLSASALSASPSNCPICAVPFKPEDLCATDIELGTCHAACLEGSPTVDLDTGEHVDGPIPTYRYNDDAPVKALAWRTFCSNSGNCDAKSAFGGARSPGIAGRIAAMSDTAKLIEELRAGLEGVTPGPWHDYIDPMSKLLYLTDDAGNTLAMTSPMEDDPMAESANAAHLARCSPHNMRLLLAALTTAHAEIERLNGVVKTLSAEIDDLEEEGCGVDDDIRKLEARATAAESTVERLREALEKAEVVLAYAAKASRLTPAALQQLADVAARSLSQAGERTDG